MGELEGYINKICTKEYMKDPEYDTLSQKSISLFNRIRDSLENKELIFEYEETISQMDVIIEATCFELGMKHAQALQG